ncbi:MAG: tetratricopeptide repeat protein, partial [Methylophilaceae bacterium]
MQKNKLNLKAKTSELQTAWNFYRLGHFSDTESICQEVLQADPKQAEALHLLGTIALQYGKAKEAVEFLTLAIKYNNKNPETLSNLGLAYHEQGLIAEAIKQYQRAIALVPQYINSHYNLHAAVLDPDNPAAAIACLKRVLSINPRDEDARFMLAIQLSYSGHKEQAEAFFAAGPQASPHYRARLDAWHYLNQKNQVLPPIMGSGIQMFTHAMRLANQEGLVLEFGVRFGTSIRVLAKMVNEVHGFDSFEGLPDEWHHEPKGSYTTKGVVPEVPANVSLHIGWFDTTLPAFLEKHEGPVRFINVDCDIYSSTKTLLELLAPRLVVGSVLVFDEYIGNEHWREDEYKAFQEAIAKYGWEYEYIAF